MRFRRNDRGAALLIVVFLLLILMLLALTFYAASRTELRMATNRRDAVQAQLTAEAGLAVGMAFLKHNLIVHPTVTSLDHAWSTYFNGSWYAGKPWTWQDGVGDDRTRIPRITFAEYAALGDALYVPRYQAGPSPATFGNFVIPPDASYQEMIHQWADVDLDEDGYRDAMWIPMPLERVFDNDGLDNNLNGVVDEPGEPAVFLYYDEATDRVWLTAPILIDYTGDGIPDPLPTLTITRSFDGRTFTLNPNAGSPDIDGLDNDFDFVVDNSRGYAYPVDPGLRPPDYRARAFHEIDPMYFGTPNGMVLTASGEPVCDIVGRFAVLITDEASKANLNTAHALSYRENFDPALGEGPMTRALNEGLGPHEYDLRILPDLGAALTNHIASLRTGARGGIGFAVDTAVVTNRINPDDSPYFPNAAQNVPYKYDVSLPGYGLVDDNGDAFWRAFNGLDDDGDGIIDNGVFFPGRLEGIDEPQEFRMFRPFRNLIAESDGLGNDPELPPGAFQELGDRFLMTREQAKLVDGIAGGIFTAFRNLVTANSADRNDRYQYFDLPGNTPRDIPAVSGLKLDYNYAFPEQIASALINDWPYRPFAWPDPFLDGLRQESVWYEGTPFGVAPYDGELRAYRLGANVVDNRDLDHVRTTVTATVSDPWSVVAGLGERRIAHTMAGAESIRINEIMVRATRRVDAEAWTDPANDALFPPGSDFTQFSPNYFSSAVLGRSDFDVTRRVIPPERIIDARNGANPVPIGIGAEWPGEPGLPGDPNRPPVPVPYGPCLSVMGRLDFDAKYGDGNEGNDRPTPPYVGAPSHIAFQAPCIRPGDDGYTDYRVGATRLTYADEWDDVQPTVFHDVPNMVQWRFGPGPGLPPGRYYLLANTTRNGNADTATLRRGAEAHLRYAFKYGRADQDIIGDALGDPASGYVDFLSLAGNVQPVVRSPIVGIQRDPNGVEAETGWVFLPGLQEPEAPPPGVPSGYCNRAEFYAYTVVIPPYAANPAEQEYLYVAVWKDEDESPDEDLVINWFEFSQEPNHEWVEVVHVGAPDLSKPPEERYVDLSGWQLQVGAPGGAGGEDDHRLFTIPDGTQIAAGGSLLLAVNKFDLGAQYMAAAATQYSNRSILMRNGIGLCATNDPSIFPMFGIDPALTGASVTVPPFPTINPVTNLPIADSVFYRSGALLEDFVDRDGDGLPDIGTLDDFIESTLGTDLAGLSGPRKAWDRIVELQNEELNALGVGTDALADIARLVLRGGVFPNYPDEDGADNDDDNPVLSSDGVDNNGDGFIDEMYEGVDEGRYLRELRRAGGAVGVPGGFNAEPVAYRTLGNPGGYSGGVYGDGAQPPEWKEFVERRFFPSDCVIITLYQGLAADRRVVDRVTYTQRDVENPSIDDAIECPYTDESGLRATLHPLNPRMWPDNTMGVDFYRSIERKHPLYAGDRFGTKNRWEATDGNYDDWDGGMGPAWLGMAGLVPWDSGGIAHGFRVYAHSVSGSPLRMNFFQRAFEDRVPAELADPRTAQFQNPAFAMRDERPLRAIRDYGLVPYWHLDRAVVRNRTYSSPGELVRLPHFTMRVSLSAVGASTPPGMAVPDQVLLGRAPHPTEPALNTLDINALLASGASCSRMLTAGTATFYPVWPVPGDPGISNYEDLVQWDVAANRMPQVWTPIFLFNLGDGVAGDLLPDFGPVGVPVQLNFFLNPPAVLPPGFVDMNEYRIRLSERWPLDRRPVMYVCANELAFDPSSRDPEYVVDNNNAWLTDTPAEALFVWTADAGVENGVFDVYVATADNLDRLNDLEASQKQALLTFYDDTSSSGHLFDGYALVDAATNTAPGDLGITVEVFTDRDGNGRCWTGSEFPRPYSLYLNGSNESFGRVVAAQPTTEGLVYYGRVRVEHNYLALFVRNWGKGGKVNRFSRVILTGVERTPGRININTATTRLEGREDAKQLVNTLVGIPGVLAADFNPDTLSFVVPADGDNLGPASSFRMEGLDKASQIVRNRPERIDGRYYDLTSELLTVDLLGDPELGLSGTLVYDTVGGPPEAQYEEKAFRYSRMANLITTRSDVFELYVLGQSGFVSTEDLNGDGRTDFRNDFIVTGEKKLRTVYER